MLRFATYISIFSSFLNKPGLGSGIEPGMPLTLIPSNVRRDETRTPKLLIVSLVCYPLDQIFSPKIEKVLKTKFLLQTVFFSLLRESLTFVFGIRLNRSSPTTTAAKDIFGMIAFIFQTVRQKLLCEEIFFPLSPLSTFLSRIYGLSSNTLQTTIARRLHVKRSNGQRF